MKVVLETCTVVCGSGRVLIRVWRREVVGQRARPLKVLALIIRAVLDHYLNIEEKLLYNFDKELHLHNIVVVV